MIYRIVLMTYLRNMNAVWKARILTQLSTIEMEELLLDELLSERAISMLWLRITDRIKLEHKGYISMLERIYLAKQDHIVHECLEENLQSLSVI